MAVLVIWLHDSSAETRTAGAISLLLGPSIALYQYSMAVLQGQQRFERYYIYYLLPAVLSSFLIALVWITGNGTLVPIALAWTIAWLLSSLAAALSSNLLSQMLKGSETSPETAKAMTRFGLTGLLGATSTVTTFRLDQALIGLFLNPFAVGLYVVATAFTNLIRFVAQSIGLVAYAHVASQTAGLAAKASLWRYVGLATLGSVAIAAALELVVDPLIPLMFGDEFADAIPVARIAILGAALAGIRQVMSDGVRGLGHPLVGSIAEGISLLAMTLMLAIAFAQSESVQTFAWCLAASTALGLIALTPMTLHSRKVSSTDYASEATALARGL